MTFARQLYALTGQTAHPHDAPAGHASCNCIVQSQDDALRCYVHFEVLKVRAPGLGALAPTEAERNSNATVWHRGTHIL